MKDSSTKGAKKKLKQLEILEKQIDIRKKYLETKKENLEILEQERKSNTSIEEQRVLLDKISELRWLLSEITVDEEKTILGSEPFLCRLIGPGYQERIEKKMMTLIEKL